MKRDWLVNRYEQFDSCLPRTILYAVVLVFIFLLAGCKTKQTVVTVPEVRTEYVHTTDSIHHTDSIIKEKETTIMMLDSAAMSEYGIKLQAAERAWLVKTKELERELQRISKIKSDTIIQIDSIPYPVPVPEYIEKQLTWWQTTRIHLGEVMLVLLVLIVIIGVVKIAKYIKL